jgi:hypothetical protein
MQYRQTLYILLRKINLISEIKGSRLFDLHGFWRIILSRDRLCGLVVRVLGYRSGGHGSIPGTTRNKK